MKKIVSALAIAIMTNYSCVANDVFVKPSNKNISYSGRVNFTNPDAPKFVFPGTTIKANFTGTSLKMKAKPNSGYFVVKIDNAEPKKINFGVNDSVLTLASGLAKGTHSAEIMLVYEGYNRVPEFRGFLLSEGGKLKKVKLPKRKLEFIGNSITCSYGIEARDPNIHYNDSTENFYYGFAAQTVRALNTQLMVVARSGIGAYRNYNGDSNGGDKDIMPRWYPYTLLYDDSQYWDLSKYRSDVICVNLGTNDFSTNGCKPELYKASYKGFIRTLCIAQPKSKIVLVTGSMMSGKNLNTQKVILDEVKQELSSEGYNNLYRFDFSPQDGSLGYGADWHPSQEQHNKMASELIPFIKSITGWK